MNLLGNNLAIDLGSVNTLVYAKGRGIVLAEPTLVAIRQQKASAMGAKTVCAMGNAAKAMAGRVGGEVITVKPIQQGVVADYYVTEQLLASLLRQANRFNLARPTLVLTIPAGANEIERRTLRETAYAAGAKKVFLIEEPVAAAIGAGLAVEESRGCMVVDIGGGTTEIGMLAFGNIVYAHSLKVGGDDFDNAIIEYLRRRHRLIVGQPTAEQLKIHLGAATYERNDECMEVHGMAVVEGTPKKLRVTHRDVVTALQPCLKAIVECIQNALQDAPTEIVSDIAQHGIILTGGSSLLHNIEEYFSEKIGVPVIRAEDPLGAVALGSGKVLESLSQAKKNKFIRKK